MNLRRVIFAAGLGLALTSAYGTQARAEERFALVIGNADYEHSRDLAAPANDARLIADALDAAGFETTLTLNAGQSTMDRAIYEHFERVQAAGPDATSFVYYAGHGISASGDNYLIPVDADVTREVDLLIEAFPMALLFTFAQDAGARVNIFAFDAATRAPARVGGLQPRFGLSAPQVPIGAAALFSVAPGETLVENDDPVSPFAETLAALVVKPGVSFAELTRLLRDEVVEITDGRQAPWSSDALMSDFVFVADLRLPCDP